MKLNKICLIMITLLCTLLIFSTNVGASRVAVISFETDGIPWTDDADFEREVLRGITREFSEILHEEADFDVIDHSRVREVLEQADYEYREGMESTMIPHISRSLENNLLILGTVNEISLSEESEISVGPVTLSGLRAKVDLSARLIDSNTGNTLARYSGFGEAAEGGFEIDEIEGLSIRSEDFADSAVGKAITEALENMSDEVVAEKEVIAEEYVEFGEEVDEEVVIEGEIVDTIGSSLVLDIGMEDGLEENFEGEFIRKIDADSDEPMTVSYGKIEISSVDDNTSIASVIESEEEPEVNDVVEVSSGSTEVGSQETGTVIETVETEDFIIYIESAIRSQDEVTVSGTVEAKNEAEFTLYIPSGLEIYDHTGGVITLSRSGTEVQLGNSTSSGRSAGTVTGGSTASVTEKVLPEYPQLISWTFDQIPEDADHLARLRLPVETESVGEIELNLDGIELTAY